MILPEEFRRRNYFIRPLCRFSNWPDALWAYFSHRKLYSRMGACSLLADGEKRWPPSPNSTIRNEEVQRNGRLLTRAIKHTAGLLPDGRVLIAGGSDERDWHGKLSSTEIYDQHGQFSSAAALNDARFKLPDTAEALNNGEVIIAGGSREVEIFDPSSGRFKIAAGQMHDQRHFMTKPS